MRAADFAMPKVTIQEQRASLPIVICKDALIDEIRESDVTVLIGETGSGKTTQVPQYLLEAGLAGKGMIAVTQPRKVAATSLAARVAAEQSVSVGGLVGYSVRFDEASSDDTRIKYVTDGMLVRELLGDPLLNRYSVVIIDEAHERTLRTDLLITNLKMIQKKRNTPLDAKGKGSAAKLNPLKIIIMSATLDAEKFSRFYDNAKIAYVKGRQHPVTIYHTVVSQPDYVDAALRTFFQIHTDRSPGDVLIFLPGQEDIESLEKSIKLYANRLPKDGLGVQICPIDTGTGFDTLLTRDITKSSAMQRAGRAGREGKGFCFRLYTEDAFLAMPISAEPEIRRCTLTSSLLQLKCLGQDLEELDFIDKPDQEAIIAALKTLFLLGALDNRKSLTKLGLHMAYFPLEPTLARAIVASNEFSCTLEVIDIISVLSSSSKLFFDTTDERDAALESRRKFRHPCGDHLTILNVVRSYEEIAASESKAGRKEWCRKQYLNDRCLVEAMNIRSQLQGVCERMDIDWRTSCGDDEQPILKSLVRGLVQHAAFLQPDGSYKQVMGPSIVKIHPSSSLCDKKVPAIVYDELIYTSHVYARGVSSVPRSLIAEIPILNHRSG
ncbi:putative ATP-dependent RNA helicase prh1 [Grifola frondosa]|uniref:RNA helicase n=1 Tax=Grifola frondosa TaxID=5627 RepID=A0A1C7M3Y0_GRIFR|nr:putative ATP-dependent RNA helicase prh1 [Grifola frondosa]